LVLLEETNPLTCISFRPQPVPFSFALLYPPSFEEPRIGGVLFDIGSVALFSGIDFAHCLSLLTLASSPVPLWLRLAGGAGGVSL
jgi:hypothetical protein